MPDSDDLFLDDLNYCVEFTGLLAGAEVGQHCIVVCDANGICDTTIYQITVVEPGTGGLPPIANDDTGTVLINTEELLDVTANDSINGSLVSVAIVVEPQFGSATINPDGTINYVPDADVCDEMDVFTYLISNESGHDTATVMVDILCDDLIIYSGFSPNGDGVNDFFVIQGIERFPNHELLVFNRWGNEVFAATDYQNNWDGTWAGKTLPDGTYFYVLKDGEGNTYSGYVQINR